jgi:hypothetical protein
MKTIYKLTFFLALVVIAFSCGEEDNLEPTGNWTMKEPVLSSPGSSIVLHENEEDEMVEINWQAAETSNDFIVTYSLLLLPANSTDLSSPLLTVTPGNGGKALSAGIAASLIDKALWAACYPAGEEADLKLVLVAKAINKTSMATLEISVTRFETEYEPTTLYITGSGTEAGSDPADATLMRTQKDGDGNPTQIYDTYINLTAGAAYSFRHGATAVTKKIGGAEGNLETCGGPEIMVAESGVYRVTANLNDNSYQLWKVDKWSLVGGPVEGGWGGDVALAYKGDGVWEGKVEFLNEENFIFRANGDWGYIIKRIQGTATTNNAGGDVIMESEAGGAGVDFEDVPTVGTGMYTVTLDLSAEGYTYRMVADDVPPPTNAVIGETNNPDGDKVSGNFVFGEYDTPAELYLVSDGVMVAQLTKDGDIFSTGKFLALQQSKTYELNSASDGSGTQYNEIGNGNISIARDQAYTFTVNFETGKLNWTYHNIKLFHWDEVGGGWDARQELLMTYIHPYKWEYGSASLTAGFHSKFNSPWDIQYGTAATALTGTMTNGGPNFTGIVQNGNYKATIVVNDTHTECTYTFVKL